MQTGENHSGARRILGRVITLSGSRAGVALTDISRAADEQSHPTVGKFLGILNGQMLTIGMISDVAESEFGQAHGATAQLDLIGEIRQGRFQRGVGQYPGIGDPVGMLSDRELRLAYGASEQGTAEIGTLQQDPTVPASVRIDDLISKHFALLGTTGVGKSNGVTIILRQILATRPDLRVFLIDPHNEYAPSFGDRAQVLNPRNLRLPFWLFNFDETLDVIFGGRAMVDEEVEVLAEVIPLAKGAYLQYRNADRSMMKRRDPRSAGFTVDTPVPYRIEDLMTLIDERMGRLENRSSRTVFSKLLGRLQTVRNDPRYGFMFDNANLGGDTMAEVLSQLFRLPANGKPMTIMQMAGFPTEVVNAVVSVLARMAFDFGLWSEGISPQLFVCEEAHRYAPADKTGGFEPSARALARIAKEGRKYGVYLGLITQRPAEIDPTIISQCNTLFVMRMSNERDQALIRSAVADAGNLLKFVPSLGPREVFAFGAGVAVPTRLTFSYLPPELRPSSDAGGATHGGMTPSRELIGSVIDRWRSATSSNQRPVATMAEDIFDLDVPSYEPPRTAGPGPAQAPGGEAYRRDHAAPPLAPAAPPPAPPLRSSILKKPLDAGGTWPAPTPPRRW